MKTLFLITALILGMSISKSQRIVEVSEEISSNQIVHLEFDFANEIKLTRWDNNKVYVKASVNINDGDYNDNFKFKVENRSGILSIESEIEDLNKIGRECYTIIIEDGDTSHYESHGAQMDLYFEVFLPNRELNLKTINGDIEVKGLDGPMDLNTINGDIDLYIPSSLEADLSMETINGTMYTDLDLPFETKKGDLCKVRGDIVSKLNGGGVEINMSTINGTMYLRKD